MSESEGIGELKRERQREGAACQWMVTQDQPSAYSTCTWTHTHTHSCNHAGRNRLNSGQRFPT